MTTTSSVVIAVLALITVTVAKAETPRAKLLEDGSYFLTSILDPMERVAEQFPNCRQVTIKTNKDGVPILHLPGIPSDPKPKDVEILLTQTGLQFQLLEKKDGLVRIYTASLQNDEIQGHLYIISFDDSKPHAGRFALQKQR